MVKGPKGRPDTQTYWSTDCRPQEELQLQHQSDTILVSFQILIREVHSNCALRVWWYKLLRCCTQIKS
jgi:hypothetical protein